jgi:hypothetical protein
VILPLQKLFDKHSLLEGDKVAPSATAKEVIASRGLYTKADLYFAMPITVRELELRLSIRALYTKAAAAADIISKS